MSERSAFVPAFFVWALLAGSGLLRIRRTASAPSPVPRTASWRVGRVTR
ncbi:MULTISPECIES: hypothetical protein [Cohnella]|nr:MULTISPECIES: hypothetical protein [Cohnella]MBN2980020.1 hypothetical protein [Cohnella algarum]